MTESEGFDPSVIGVFRNLSVKINRYQLARLINRGVSVPQVTCNQEIQQPYDDVADVLCKWFLPWVEYY